MKRILVFIGLCLVLCAALTAQSEGQDLAILNRIMRLKMDGLIPLRFVNALDGSPVEGASVAVTGIGNFTTDMHGIVTFPEQEDGFYTLEFSRQGFITSRMEFEVKLNNVFTNQISVSPVMRGDYLRIVLDWGQHPADLDLHFVKEGDGGYHISYWNMRSAADGSVLLDRDAMRGFGPETITIMETDLRAVYRLYVHDYTNRNNASSSNLSRSGAIIRVYGRSGLLHTFRIPENRAGVRWDVFRIVNGQVQ
ncbi:MAG: hypothetical protein FWG89_05030 [Treponema sp.]|nr:hypothetical protein [Treponema sp.]